MKYAEVIQLINKEFAIEIAEKRPYSEMHAELAEHLNHLVKSDFDKLITYLYRIDVEEEKLKNLLQQNPQQDAGSIMATLIIERELQKIKTREQFSSRDNKNMDEEEKW